VSFVLHALTRREQSLHDDGMTDSLQFSRSEQRDGMQESADSLMDELVQEKAALSKVRSTLDGFSPVHL
jgi:hypothetical protein